MIGDRETKIKGSQDRDEHQLDCQSHLKRNVSSKVLVILLCYSSTSVRKESGVLLMSLFENKMMEVNNQNRIKRTRKEKETQLQWRTLAMVLKIKLELLNLKSRTGDQEKH